MASPRQKASEEQRKRRGDVTSQTARFLTIIKEGWVKCELVSDWIRKGAHEKQETKSKS